MCGIAGLYWLNEQRVELDVLKSMAGCLTHRGPDEEGFFTQDRVGLAFRRLAVIDLKTGSQPLFSEDRSAAVVFNGEIYNFQAIREELKKEGHRFRTQSDTEILVHLFERTRSLEFLNRLNGMFAFAVYDVTRDTLWFARDRTGKKPLYYYWDDKCFAFASEIQALTVVPGLDLGIDPQAVSLYFRYGYVPAPLSIYRKIRKLEPAHWLKVSRHEGLKTGRWWRLPKPGAGVGVGVGSLDEKAEEFGALFADAVRVRTISDVPLGAFLSGGVDSSAVVAEMARLSPERVSTFSIRFKESSFDESHYSSRTAARLNTKHVVHDVTADLVGEIPRIVRSFGEPYADSSAIPTYFLCQAAREHVTVALSGDGADEICGGYNRYVAAQVMGPLLDRCPGALRALSWLSRIPDGHGYYAKSWLKKLKYFARFSGQILRDRDQVAPLILTPLEEHGFFQAGFLNECSTFTDPVRLISREWRGLSLTERLMWTDFESYLPDDIHVKVDRMSMAHSLEVRCPFMDFRLVEFMAGLPLEFKIRGFRTKILLKRYASGQVPEAAARKKQGFEVPMADWIRGELGKQMQERFTATRNQEFLDSEGLLSLLQDHRQSGRDHARKLWAAFVFLGWLDNQGYGDRGGLSPAGT